MTEPAPAAAAPAAEPPPDSRRFITVLLAILFATHAWALYAFGATFWIDSSVFAAFAAGLGSIDQFRAIYDTTGTLMYSHISIGLPALWAALSVLPANLQWPALALIQHALAVGACAATFITLHRLWPNPWHLAAAALLSLHPFYQALHNALLTESITSSLLLLGLALTLRLFFLPAHWRRDFLLLLLCTALITQFRSYAGAMLAAMAIVVLWKRRTELDWKPWASVAAVFLAASALLPAARWAATGRWFTAGLGTNALLFATWVHPAPSPALFDRIRSLGWIPDDTVPAMFERSFDYPKARAIAEAWLAQGASESEVRSRLATLSRTIEFDSAGALLTKLRCGLASCGWTTLAFAGDSSAPIYQHRTAAEQRAQKLGHLRWLSWVEKPSYRRDGEGFFLHMATGIHSGVEAQRALWQALRKHIADRSPVLRDPLRLAVLPPDFCATLGLAGIALCFWKCRAVGVILAIPLAVNFAVTTLASLAGPRYAYALFPVSLVAVAIGAALLTSPAATRR